MEIKYVTKLQENPALYPKEQFPKNSQGNERTWEDRNEGMTEEEINKLEADVKSTFYPNQECKFPRAFKELLFLAGHYCYVIDVYDTLWENDADIKTKLAETNQNLPHSFFVVETYDGESFIIYLDENKEDPDIYILAFGWETSPQPHRTLRPVTKDEMSLSKLINHRVKAYLDRRDYEY